MVRLAPRLALWTASIVVLAACGSGSVADDGATADVTAREDSHGDATDAGSFGDAFDAPRASDAAMDFDASPARDASVPDSGGDVAITPILNPVIQRNFADPFILRVGTTYHAYATTGTAMGAVWHILHATSGDLATWRLDHDAMPTLAPWIDASGPETWAPSVLAVSPTRYVLFYTAHLNGTPGQHCVGRAIANTPAGPFVDRSTAPLACVTNTTSNPWSLDPSPLRTPTGEPYLLWRQDAAGGATNAVIRRLDATGAAFATGSTRVTLLVRNTTSWEEPIMENPSMFAASNGRFYLFYSANLWRTADYAIGYAECTTPTGPCTRRTVTAPWLGSRGAFAGPGGQDFFTDTTGAPWMAWHAWTRGQVGPSVGARSLWLGHFDVIAGIPTVDPVPARPGL